MSPKPMATADATCWAVHSVTGWFERFANTMGGSHAAEGCSITTDRRLRALAGGPPLPDDRRRPEGTHLRHMWGAGRDHGSRAVCLPGNDYLDVDYRLDDYTSGAQKFVQVAIARLPELEGARTVIALTEGARKKHWKELADRFAERKLALTAIDIKDGRSDDELWENFDTIGSVFSQGDEVWFDLTHGFRSLSATAILAIGFFRHVKKLKIARVFYGAAETIPGWMQDYKMRLAETRIAEEAPIFDLTEMFSLPAWAEAVTEWQRTGRADGLIDQTRPIAQILGRKLKRDAPSSITTLPAVLGSLSDALTLVRHDQIAATATAIHRQLEDVKLQAKTAPALTPWGHLAELIAADVSTLTVFADGSSPWTNEQVVTDAYLRNEIAGARWLQQRRRPVEAFCILREVVTSCAVRIALAAGVTNLPQPEKPPVASDEEAFRSTVDRWLMNLSGARGKPSAPIDNARASEIGRLQTFANGHPELSSAWKEAASLVSLHRNKLDHAWTGREHSNGTFNSELLKKILSELNGSITLVAALVALLPPLESP